MSSKDKKAEQHIHELEEQLKQLTGEKQELTDKLQRLSADYANYQKRVPRQVADSVAYEKRSLVKALIPSLDNFEHAFSSFGDVQNDPAAKKVIDGMRLIFDHLLDALKTIGVEKVVSVGQPFDPQRHEAMMQRCEPEKDDNIVLEEYLPCYLLAGEPLRPAKVIVNKLPQPEISEPQSEQAAANDETTDTEPEVQ